MPPGFLEELNLLLIIMKMLTPNAETKNYCYLRGSSKQSCGGKGAWASCNAANPEGWGAGVLLILSNNLSCNFNLCPRRGLGLK